MKDFFNISNNRETSCIWRFIVDPSQADPFVIEEVRTKPDSTTMEKIEGINRRSAQTQAEIIEMIKAYRKPASGGQQEAEEDETLYEIKVTMKDQGPFTGISDYLTIVDMPGIEDGIKSFFIKNYVDENQPRLVPAILVNLTQGAFTEL